MSSLGAATTRTYTDAQIEERGRDVAMAASEKLLALLRSGGAPQSDLLDSYASAVMAGTSLMASVPETPEEE